MPKLKGKIHPFLVAVALTGRRSKQLVYSGKCGIRQCDKVVFEHSFQLVVLGVLAAVGFKHQPDVIFGYVLRKRQSVGKTVVGNLDGVCLVGLDLRHEMERSTAGYRAPSPNLL
jgi:hypothetical protein